MTLAELEALLNALGIRRYDLPLLRARRAAGMLRGGMPVSEVQAALRARFGVSRATAYRDIERARRLGE